MANYLRDRGAMAEAEVLYRRALTIRQDAGSLDSSETVDVLQRLGFVCEQQVGVGMVTRLRVDAAAADADDANADDADDAADDADVAAAAAATSAAVVVVAGMSVAL